MPLADEQALHLPEALKQAERRGQLNGPLLLNLELKVVKEVPRASNTPRFLASPGRENQSQFVFICQFLSAIWLIEQISCGVNGESCGCKKLLFFRQKESIAV